MSQRQQLERLLEIHQQIRAGHYPTAERIAAKLEVIYEDKKFMVERLGAPIEFDHEHGGWFYTDPAWKPPTMYATESELLAFFLSVEVAGRYQGTTYETHVRSAVDKLAVGLGGHMRVSLEQLSAAYTAPLPDQADPRSPGALGAGGPDLLSTLQRAIQDRHPVHMRYYTAGRDEWNECAVQPCLLYRLNEHWHVFGIDHLRREMRNFRADRIDNLQVMAQAVSGPAR